MTPYNDEANNPVPKEPTKVGIWDDRPLFLGMFGSYPIPRDNKIKRVVGIADFFHTCETCLKRGQPHPKFYGNGAYVKFGAKIFVAHWRALWLIPVFVAGWMLF